MRDLLGGDPTEVPQAYADADPAVVLAGGTDVPVIVLHGSADRHVPLANSDWASRTPGVELRVLGPGPTTSVSSTPGPPSRPRWLLALDDLAGGVRAGR